MIGSIAVRSCGILLGSCLVGCVGGGAPSARVVDATVEQTTSGSSVVAFVVEARTRTKEAIPMPRVRYELRSGGRVLFRGVRSPEATIPPEGSITFRLPVALDEAPDGLAYELVGEVSYIAPGALAEAFYDNGLSRPSMPLRDSGVIKLNDAP